jgi:hypothetical protein
MTMEELIIEAFLKKAFIDANPDTPSSVQVVLNGVHQWCQIRSQPVLYA